MQEQLFADEMEGGIFRGLAVSLVIVFAATLSNGLAIHWVRLCLGWEPLPLPWLMLEGWLLCWAAPLILAPFCLLRRRT